jgi:hypothetical protein
MDVHESLGVKVLDFVDTWIKHSIREDGSPGATSGRVRGHG